MGKHFLISLFLHLAVLIFFVGINFIFPKKVEVPPRVIMDVAIKTEKAPIGKKTQIKKQKKVKAKSKPKPKPKPKKKPKKVKKKVVKKPKPKKKPKLTTKKKAEKKVIKKKKVENKSKKALKDLKPKKTVVSEKDAKKTTVKKKDIKKNVKKVNDVKDSPNKSKTTQNLNGPITKDEFAVVRQQIKECWKVPAGIKDAGNLVTKIKISLKDDGTVISTKIHDTSISLNNPSMQIMAESAERAINSPKCNKLKLPKAKYDQWKKIIITFDPKTMLD